MIKRVAIHLFLIIIIIAITNNSFSNRLYGSGNDYLLLNSRANSDYSFTLTCNNNTHITNGGDPTGYYIEAKNTGTMEDTIIFSCEIINVTGGTEPDASEWYVRLDREQMTLLPGESVTIILSIATACNCQEGTIATVRLTGQSSNEPSVILSVDTYTTRGPKEGDQLVDIEIENFMDLSEPHAGKPLTFSLKVYNYQSVSQSYNLINLGKPPDWTVEFDENIFNIELKSKVSIPITLNIPAKNNPNDYLFNFSVKSINDPTIIDFIDVIITLQPELALTEIKSLNATPTAGEPLAIEVTFSNIGPAVARNFVLKLYNSSGRTQDSLIYQTTIPELYGETKMMMNFTWLPMVAKVYNITGILNPDFIIPEMSNRYGNNIITSKIMVQEPEKPNIPKDGDDGAKTADNYMVAGIGITIFILIILVLIYFFTHRTGSAKDEERTAKKIPLSRSFDRADRDRHARARQTSSGKKDKKGRGGKGKKARKEKLTAHERARLKAMEKQQRNRKRK